MSGDTAVLPIYPGHQSTPRGTCRQNHPRSPGKVYTGFIFVHFLSAVLAMSFDREKSSAIFFSRRLSFESNFVYSRDHRFSLQGLQVR